MSTTSSDEDTIFNKEYESSILAVISGQFVSFPEAREPINGTLEMTVCFFFLSNFV